ncbi:MAG: hypothetical protein AAF766_22365 [Cyanobacteria bacterium P01_D01_bin.14]
MPSPRALRTVSARHSATADASRLWGALAKIGIPDRSILIDNGDVAYYFYTLCRYRRI